MKTKAVIPMLLVSLTLLSCGKIKELEEKTDNMEHTMVHMDSNMTTMFLQVRQKESEDTRSKQIEKLEDSNTDMGAKLTAAKKYLIAYEYQSWTGDGVDNHPYRAELMLDAMEEFYRILSDYSSSYIPTSPVEINKANNRTKILYALATTLHFNNVYQENLAHRTNGMETTSILDIMKSALQKNTAAQKLTEAEIVVVRGQNLAITKTLLNARMNFMTALAVKDLVTKDNMSKKNLFKGLLYSVSKGSYGKLVLDSVYEKQNTYTQEDITAKIDSANKAKAVLIANKMSVNFDRKLKSILKNLKRPSNDQGTQNNDHNRIYNSIKSLIK